jgi:hypothetical protein
MKLILKNSTQSDLGISKFKTSIQSCKVWEKHQNNKTSYGVEVFPEKNMFLFPTFQKSLFYNDPHVLPKMITLKNSYGQFKFKW